MGGGSGLGFGILGFGVQGLRLGVMSWSIVANSIPLGSPNNYTITPNPVLIIQAPILEG